jgi:hypothetical protein
MGIFNLSNVSEPAQKSVVQSDNEFKAGQVVKPQEPVSGQGAQDGDVKSKTVVMTGPLSKIYSEALNLVYGKESMNMVDPEEIEVTNGQTDGDEDRSLYVYTTDGDNLDGDEMVAASDKLRLALDSKKYKKVLLAVECKTPSRKVALLHEMATSMGVNVVFSRYSALENMKACLT